jgi:hypothetical protein
MRFNSTRSQPDRSDEMKIHVRPRSLAAVVVAIGLVPILGEAPVVGGAKVVGQAPALDQTQASAPASVAPGVVTSGGVAPQEPGAEKRLSYRIEASIDPERGASGTARMTVPFSALWSPSEVRLDLLSAGEDSLGAGTLHIESVTSSRSVEIARDSAGVLRIVLRAPARPGDLVELDVRFSTVFDEQIRGWLGYASFWSHEPGAYWYPDVIAAGEKRVRFKDFEVTLEYPAGHALLTTGVLTAPPERDGDVVRATYRADHVEGFSLSIAEGLETLELEGDGYTVVGLLPPDEAEALAFRRVVALAAEAVEWYRDGYGFFPVEQIGIIPGPRQWGGGFPLPNVFMIHRANLNEDFLRWITAHELGHYYWGLYALSATSERLDWLNLANGIWIDHLYLARTSGRTLEEQWRAPGGIGAFTDFLQAQLENREARLGLTREEESPLDFDYNSLIRHSKAAIGVYLQSRPLGAERFLDVQRGILADHRFGPFGIEEFVRRLEEAGAAGAGEFFDAWQRGDAWLHFEIAGVESEPNESSWTHRVTVRRPGTVPYEVDVELVYASGARVVRTLSVEGFGDEREQVLEVTSSEPLRDVRLDPNGALPMWNSSHPDIRRAFLQAMVHAGMTEPFLALARAQLAAEPDDDFTRYLLTSELFALGRHEEVVAGPVAEPPTGQVAEACATRDRCRTAILIARSLSALGHAEEAGAILAAIEEQAAALRLSRTWGQAYEEIRGR